MDEGSFKAILNTEERPALIGLQKKPGHAPVRLDAWHTQRIVFIRTGTGLNGGIGQRRSEVVPKYRSQSCRRLEEAELLICGE